MQRHIPLGYCVAQGKAEIERKTSQIVQDIYTSYDNEASCNAIAKDLTAKGILTANQKAIWHCCMVGKILENKKYLGDDFYPRMIEDDLFGGGLHRLCRTEERNGRKSWGKQTL